MVNNQRKYIKKGASQKRVPTEQQVSSVPQ